MTSTLRSTRRIGTMIAATAALIGGSSLLAAPSASAADRDGVCDEGEFCLYYNSDHGGSVSDFAESVSDYGASQPTCYEFKGDGAGKGDCVKNDAASAWNRTDETVRLYFNSGYSGASQDFGSGDKVNLNSTLKNENAGHKIDPGSADSGEYLLPFPCKETWTASTRADHSPPLAVDFNHYPDDNGYKVYASAAGTVSLVANTGSDSYGQYIVIDHGGGKQTLYAHLSSQDVSEGDKVSATTMIGRVGSTGGSTGPHLHYEQKEGGQLVKATFAGGNPSYPENDTELARSTDCP